MVSSAEIIEVIADRLSAWDAKNIVVDPVMVATSGARLIAEDAAEALTRRLFPLATDCAALLSDEPAFFLINSYTTGLSASVLKNILTVALPVGYADADEVGLPIARGGLTLPCGASGRWYSA